MFGLTLVSAGLGIATNLTLIENETESQSFLGNFFKENKKLLNYFQYD